MTITRKQVKTKADGQMNDLFDSIIYDGYYRF